MTLRDNEPELGTTANREPKAWLGPGTIIDGRYELGELIGEGGMGQVYEGEHLGLRRKVAIKVLVPQGDLDEHLARRFEREAMALAAVAHRNVVAVMDYGVYEGTRPYLVMELLEGRSLADLLTEQGALPVERAVGMIRQVLAGLAHAHAQGLVHRDLKPGNVWIESHPDGDLAKLLDFGFAKPISPDTGTRLTADGIVVGTLTYMSPEQASGGAVDHRSDLYSAGVLFFEMVTGCRPFSGDPVEVLRAHITLEPPTLSATRLDLTFTPALEIVVRRALEKSPVARFQSAQALAEAFSNACSSEHKASAATVVEAGSGPRSSDVSGEKTLIDDEPRTLADDEAMAILLDSKTLALGRRRSAGDASEIALRSAEIEAMQVIEAAVPSASRPAPAPAPRTDRKTATIAALGVVGLAILVIVARRATPPPPPPDASQLEDATALTEVATPNPESTEAVEHVDFWSLYPHDEQLERYRRHVDSGDELARPMIRELRLFEREHPEDPRANLVMARGFMNLEWFRDALELYAEAYAKDERVAVNDDFLDALVELARYKVTSDRAAGMLAEIYGPRALPAIEAELDETRDDPAAAARLAGLARRLGTSPD